MKNKNFKFNSLKFLLISFNIICLILLIFGYFIIKPNLVIASGTSMEPTIKNGNAIIFKKQKKYNLFDIISFNLNGIVITHRIIDIKIENDAVSYICSGDNINLATINSNNNAEKHEYIKNLTLEQIKTLKGVQIVKTSEILGKTKTNSAFLGGIIKFRFLILSLLIIPTIILIYKRS